MEAGHGTVDGNVTDLIFKGVHYEMCIDVAGREWVCHSTRPHIVGEHVGIEVDPFNIQVMKKPESEDEEAITANE